MPETPKKFYLTTPIYYVNARPHIGHAYTTIVADVVARRHRLLGDDTYFLTGTDEHGQKIERSATAAGIPPQQFADEVAASFEGLWKRMGITNDQFIRTTDPKHQRGAQKLFQTLFDRGYIELRSYTGTYCVSDEAFVDVPVGTPCPECGRITETITEENYFFKLSEFQERLIGLIESGELSVEPEARRNEVLSFVRGGLKDLSISRTSFKWGIPVPGNEKHVIYVWLDALANYMTAVGYGSDDPADKAMFERYWPADLHLVGKEIIRFHCVYWPAFLLAAELPLPKKIQAHGWLLFEESKMSKSRGNIVRTETILDAFGDEVYGKQFPESTKAERDLFASDVLRYFLLREIPFGQDGSFSFDALIQRYNSDLANGYGNLVSRTFSMINQYFDGIVPDSKSNHLFERFGRLDKGDYSMVAFGPEDIFRARRDTAYAEAPMAWHWAYMNSDSLESAFDNFSCKYQFGSAIETIAWGVAQLDGFITRHIPWKIAAIDEPEAREALKEIIYTTTQGIRIITALLYPILPCATAAVWRQLGLGSIEEAAAKGELKDLHWGGLKPGTKLGPLAPIFPRADKGLAQIMSDMELKNVAQNASKTSTEPELAQAAVAPAAEATTQAETPRSSAAATASDAAKPEAPAQIGIDDFAKVELRVAQIVVAERIPKADKLLRLEVDLGASFPRRQILSGIAEWYTPEELIGRRIAVIANLAPRKMRGLESHGMLLAASDDSDPNVHGKPVLASFSDDVPLGARIR